MTIIYKKNNHIHYRDVDSIALIDKDKLGCNKNAYMFVIDINQLINIEKDDDKAISKVNYMLVNAL